MSNTSTAADDFFGTPSYQEKKGGKSFKIGDGDNVFRILPPCGNLAKEGVWAVQARRPLGAGTVNSTNG